MKKTITIFFIICNLITFGQHNFGLKINGGVSKIDNTTNISNGTVDIQFAPSVQMGIFYNFDFTKKSNLNIELLFNQIEGKEITEFDFTDNYGNVTGKATIDFNKHLSYISLPILYGFKIKRFKIKVGFQLSFLIANSGNSKTMILNNGEYSTIEDEYDKLYIDTYDYGSVVGFSYEINKKIIIGGNFYYGLNNILENENYNLKWKNQQITIGLKYILYQINNNETNE